MAKPIPEIKAIQERVAELLPQIIGEGNSVVRVLVQADRVHEGFVNVRFQNEHGGSRVIHGEVTVIQKWPRLVLADFLAKHVKALLHPEE